MKKDSEKKIGISGEIPFAIKDLFTIRKAMFTFFPFIFLQGYGIISIVE